MEIGHHRLEFDMQAASDAGKNELPIRPDHVPRECLVDVDVYDLPGSKYDVHGAWVALQRSNVRDLIWTPRNGGHWIALRGELVHRLIGDSEKLSSRIATVPTDMIAGSDYIPLQLDPPRHTPYRSAVMRSFGAKLLLALADPIRISVRSLVADVRDRGECEFMSEVAEIIPITVFLNLVGLPLSDRPYLRSLVEQLSRPDGSTTGAAVMHNIVEYLKPVVDNRLTRPGHDLFSRVLSMPVEGRAWTRDEAMRMCRNLLVGGLDTVVAMLGFTAFFLAQHPDHQAELRNQPSLCESAADEFIRRFAPVQLAREIVVDHEIEGILLRAGDVVVLPTMLHNLDERSFNNPLVVDFSRGPVRHSTMGNGAHRCVGAGLARMEVATFLREWTSGIGEFRIADNTSIPMQAGTVCTIKHLPLHWAKPEWAL